MKEIGFDGVQLHLAHGYLLSDCLTNGKIDFVKDVVNKVLELRSENFMIAAKINGED